MLRKIDTIAWIILLLQIASSNLSGAAAYASKGQMIKRSELIVIAQIDSVEKVEKDSSHWTFRERASATINKTLKGSATGDINIYGGENFICAQTKFEPGVFLLFLNKHNDLWVGSNWNLGVRPILNGLVDWFDDDGNLFTMAPTPLDGVIREISSLVELDQKLADNPVWKYMSPDNTSLAIPRRAEVSEIDFRIVKENGGFDFLKNIKFSSQEISEATLDQFLGFDIDSLYLNQCKFSNDKLMELLASFKNLVSINLASTPITDETLYVINGDNLESITIYNTNISDRSLVPIGRFKNLKFINLSGSNLSEEGFENLKGYQGLEKLFISGKGVTDKIIENFKESPLEEISIAYGSITDKSLDTISRVSTLKKVRFYRCKHITDDGIQYLSELPEISGIDLSGTNVTDKSLEHLIKMQKLKTIHLRNCRISDEGLQMLNELPSLRYLQIGHSNVTMGGVNKLKQSNPKLNIVHTLN